MNWLITGGCGFIGRSLISKLLSNRDNRIRVLDNLSVGTTQELNEIRESITISDDKDLNWSHELVFVEGDILDEAAVFKVVNGADVVVHLAANTGVGPSVEDPLKDSTINIRGTLNVLEGCRKHNVGRFIFASSGAPIGVQVPPLHEEMAPHPASPYGASKLSGEGYCSAYFHCFGIETVALRFGNVFGELSGQKQSVVAKFIKQAMNDEIVEIYGDGSQTRDFIYVGDLIRAIILSASVPQIGGHVFQIASAEETTILELCDTLFDVLRSEGVDIPDTYFGEKRVGDVMRNYSDTSKAERILGWTPEIPLREGLQRTVRYFKSLN
jgi:UDP-glucose 4-epimerase